MRLWHKDLIPYLPKQQLLGQWRECCCIAKNLATKGTPNHILVNKILDYPLERDFTYYCGMIIKEIKNRGYNISTIAYNNWEYNMAIATKGKICNFKYDCNILFNHWHNKRYLKQCLFNLEEKYLCGGITHNEWLKIKNKFYKELK